MNEIRQPVTIKLGIDFLTNTRFDTNTGPRTERLYAETDIVLLYRLEEQTGSVWSTEYLTRGCLERCGI